MSALSSFIDSPEKLYSFIGASLAIAIPLSVNVIKEFYFDWKKRKTEESYLIVQLIFLLDEFVARCGAVAWDVGYDTMYPPPSLEEYQDQVQLPFFDITSIKGEHKFLKPLMLYRLIGINIDITKSKNVLSEHVNSPSFGYHDLDEYYDLRRREFANIGLKASYLAEELREKFKIPNHEDWNPKGAILRSLKQLNRERARIKFDSMYRKSKRIMAEVNRTF